MLRRGQSESDTLLPSAARTASVNGDAVEVNDYSKIACYLNVTVVSGTSPTLDVKLQDSSDGVNWVDIPSGAFTQATATGVKRLVVSDVGRYVRAVATIGGTTPSFTFDVKAVGR